MINWGPESGPQILISRVLKSGLSTTVYETSTGGGSICPTGWFDLNFAHFPLTEPSGPWIGSSSPQVATARSWVLKQHQDS
jgi:hypothetical protein